MSGPALVRLLKKHVISEAVNLDQQVIDQPLICHKCTFESPITAVGATFKRTVDLSGSTFEGDVDMSQATFLAPALFGPGGPNTTKRPFFCANSADGTWFQGKTNFTLATFDSLAMFQAAVFSRQQTLDLVRFNADAVFAQGCSQGTSYFRRAVFAGVADFGVYRFQRDTLFDDAGFRSRPDFSQATFAAGASFLRTRFEQGATFEAAHFNASGESDDAFIETVAGGALDFSSATFSGIAHFMNVRVSGDMSFEGATITPHCTSYDNPTKPDGERTTHCLYLDKFSAGTFELGVQPALHAVYGPQRAAILEKIESSAKAADNLALANDAHYERQVLSSEKDSLPLYVLDFVFYRTLAGYLVRPLQPLVALLALAALITLVRDRPSEEKEKTPPRSGIGRRVHEAGIRLGTGYAKTLSLVGRGKAVTDPRPLKSVEAFCYRLLLVCVLIGLANSNPTLRQMVDAVH